jgi:fatty acid desaturase
MSLIVYIKDVPYDLTNFQNKHPGGRYILQFLKDKDATSVFEQYHSLKVLQSGIIDKYRLNTRDSPYILEVPEYYLEMKHEIEIYLKNNELSNIDYTYIQLFRIILLWFGCVYTFFRSIHSPLYMIPYIVCSTEIGFHLVHDASHGVLLENKTLSHIIGYISYDILSGLSYVNWINQHILGHHVHCNIDGKDPDIDAYPIRLCKTQKYLWFHKYQYLYCIPLYCMLTTSIFMNDMKTLFTKSIKNVYHKQSIVLGKCLHIGIFIIIPYLYMGVTMNKVLVNYIISHMIGSFIISLIFQISHISDKTCFNTETNWITNQLLTTHDYSHCSVITFVLTGGLNYQVIHHLFPKVSQIYYPNIQPIVTKVCKKHNIVYNYSKNIWLAVKSHFVYLYQMSFI